MIDIGIYVALGFLAASLLALLLVPALWNRAVRLTSKKLESTMPMSVADIQADKDQLRAEYAIKLRRVEMALDKAKEKAIREQVEANKRRVKIAEINAELAASKATMEEHVNANRVLEQTIKKRLPDLDGRLKAAKDVIAELETTNAELRRTTESQGAALKSTRAAAQTQKADITQLRKALEGGTGRGRGIGKSQAKEIQLLSAELSRLREELERNRVHREENDALRQELNRLATQILAVAKGQGVDLPLISEALTPLREVRNLADTVASLSQRPEPVAPEPIFPYGNGIEREPEPELVPESAAPAEEQDLAPTFVTIAEEIDVRLGEPAPEVEAEVGEPHVEDGFAGSYEEGGHESGDAAPKNGEVRHDDEDEIAHEDEPALGDEDEIVHHTEPTHEHEDEVAHQAKRTHEDEIEQIASDDEADDGVPKGPLARRLAARRTKRRSMKGSGKSLSERLRGIAAEADG
jgi:hypothetical protein